MEGMRYLIRNNDLYLEYHAIFRWLPNFVFNYLFQQINKIICVCIDCFGIICRVSSFSLCLLSLSSFLMFLFLRSRGSVSREAAISRKYDSQYVFQSNICLLKKIERVKRGADTCSEFSVAGLIIKTHLGRARAIGFVWAELRWEKKRKRETWRENRWYKNGDPYIPAMYGATWPYKGV